jgi:ActD protein
MRSNFLVATFSDANSLMQAVVAVRRENFRIYDVYAPYPIHGLDDAMGLRRTRLPLVTLLAGVSGLVLALSFQFYASILDWPMNVGGKPDNSTLAFIPICFELAVLMAGLATVAALFLRARLYPGRREQIIVEGVTNNLFALVLRKRDSLDTVRAGRILLQSGADEIEEKEAEL